MIFLYLFETRKRVKREKKGGGLYDATQLGGVKIYRPITMSSCCIWQADLLTPEVLQKVTALKTAVKKDTKNVCKKIVNLLER